MAVKKIATFDDWIEAFRGWQKDIGLRLPRYNDYPFEAKYGDLRSDEIEYGDFRGEKKWERVTQIPQQPIRDALLNLIVYQGDTEFASVEQQRNLLDTSPSDYDTDSVCRIMTEEMRHGWQMCHLLVNHFGETGRVEARKLLERRSWQNNRLLGSFNVDVDNWVDFFTYTEFVDRDGKFQLNMLSTSSFAPLARSMGPMLREEGFHLGTGHMGLQRIAKAGRVPPALLQKYVNKWVSTAYDLFGKDSSSSAEWFYVWGLKGRYDEARQQAEPDKAHLNEFSRELYRQEVEKLLEGVSRLLPAGAPPLEAPDLKFHRAIGEFSGQTWSVRGELLTPAQYQEHLAETLPTEEEKKFVADLMREPGWIASRESVTAAP
ncbi:MAG TPA: Phenylacetic acid catabolic protein [Thermoanaerobaculia bacterium]|nr:Phenylacetic acid catabolic protein [Thermoanaerobaculia bacterium]